MDKLVLHPASRTLLQSYGAKPVHALLLSGVEGVGLCTIATELANALTSKSSIVQITPEKGSIPIERIRQLYEQTRSVHRAKQVVHIDDAEAMSLEAQNALLKLLEEPVENVHFILTSHHPEKLLETIRSRMQQCEVRQVSEGGSRKLLSKHKLNHTQITQALFLASGRPAELVRLATDTEYFTARAAVVVDARSFLQADTYDKLVLVKKYTARDEATELLEMCTKLLAFNLVSKHHLPAVTLIEQCQEVIARLQANAHVRTQLMYLVTKLS